MSEASRRPAHDAGPDAPAQASSIATTRPPIPRLPVGRLAFLLLACRNILGDELDLGDGTGAVPVALAEVFAGLLFIWSGETAGTGRAVLSGEEDFVGVHIGYFLRFTFPVFLPYFLGVA